MNKNILLILTDQQSATMMSCAGNRRVKTPAMDSLAERGTRFDLAFCTNPVCIPSRFSMFTGRYPTEIGQRGNFFTGRQLPTHIVDNGLGHVIRAAGYDVVYGGKEHLPSSNATELGFDYICKDEREELAEECAGYLLNKQAADKPFFMVASFINPHDICHLAINEFATAGFDLMLKEKCVVEGRTVEKAVQLPPGMSDDEFYGTVCPPLPPNHALQQDEPAAVAELVNQRDFRKKARESWDEKGWRRHRWAYAQLTERVDRQIAQVLDALKASGLEKDTVIIFTSDHGDHDSSHKLEHKTALYEEAIRIPFIIADPACANPGRVDCAQLVCNGLDLFPTICDYAGAPVPADLTGVSLRPAALDSEVATDREHVLIESEFGYGIRTADMLYALYDKGENREQLYDLVIDPGQTRNFARLPDYAGRLEALREMAAGYRIKIPRQ